MTMWEKDALCSENQHWSKWLRLIALQLNMREGNSRVSGWQKELALGEGWQAFANWLYSHPLPGHRCLWHVPCRGCFGRPVSVSRWRCGSEPGTTRGRVPPPPALPTESPSPAPVPSSASAVMENMTHKHWFSSFSSARKIHRVSLNATYNVIICIWRHLLLQLFLKCS